MNDKISLNEEERDKILGRYANAKKKILVALGGNALITHGESGIIEQEENAKAAVKHLVKLLEEGNKLVITHGNGPQVGDILLRNEIAKDTVPAMPLDVCGAESQGMIGYVLQQSLYNELRRKGKNTPVATILTQSIVDKADPAFKKPTKPIGPFYTKIESSKLSRKKGWKMINDSGRGYRRVVPSPRPIAIPEFPIIKELFDRNYIIIQSGGGGIPVVRKQNGTLIGVEAVVDKDLCASLLASLLKTDVLLILTDVDKVRLNYGRPDQRSLDRMTADECKKYLAEGQFPAGSMGPKIEAAMNFVKSGKEKTAIITSLELAETALKGETGTRIVNS